MLFNYKRAKSNKLKPSIEKALNEQVNAEFFSAYLYMSMVTYFESIGYKKEADFFRKQAKGELKHAVKFCEYIMERGSRAKLTELKKPQSEWKSPLKAAEDTLEHEKMITGRINDLVELAKKENDSETEKMLKWFVKEQVEEEEVSNDLIKNLNKKASFNYKRANRKIKAGMAGELYQQIKQLIESVEEVNDLLQVRDGINQLLSEKYNQLTAKEMPPKYTF